MAVILRVLGGLLIIIGGIVMVIKTEWFLVNFGRIDWAERHLGFEGGTRLFYKLLGVFACVMGIMVALNLFRSFFLATVGQLLLNKEQQQRAEQQLESQ